MNTAEPLTIPQAALAHIKRMAGATRDDRNAERELYFAIKSLGDDQQAELLALVMLGRAGHRSFTVALASAKAQDPTHIAGVLAEKSNLQSSLANGLKRYARQVPATLSNGEHPSGMPQKIELRRVEDLRPFAPNAEVYGDTCDQALIDSVGANGIQEPLVVLADGTVLGGHRRLAAAKEAHLAEVPVRVCQDLDESAAKYVLLQLNLARTKTLEMRLREFELYRNLESTEAVRRKGQRTDLRTKLSIGRGGRARELAAEKVGLSGTSAAQGLKVMNALRKHCGDPESERVRELLNGKGISSAFDKAVQLGWFPSPRKATKGASVPSLDKAKPAEDGGTNEAMAAPSDITLVEPLPPSVDDSPREEDLETPAERDVVSPPPEETTPPVAQPASPATVEIGSSVENLPPGVLDHGRVKEAMANRVDELKEGPEDAAEIRRFMLGLAAFTNQRVGRSPTAATLRNLHDATCWLKTELDHLSRKALGV